jgi:hypothetical protein
MRYLHVEEQTVQEMGLEQAAELASFTSKKAI